MIEIRKKSRWTVLAAAPLLALLVASGCDVEQTEEGEMPDVDVESGELPEYDVDVADVDVGTRTETVEVPKVRVVVEEEEVEVPFVDVEWPGEDTDRVEQQVTVRLDVPNDSYDVAIQEIHIVNDEMWVLSRLSGSGTGEGMRTRVMDTVVVKAPEMDVKHFVIGDEAQGVNAQGDGDYEFVQSRSEIADDLQQGRRIYSS